MDGGGRLDRPLTGSGPTGVEHSGASTDEPAPSRARALRRARRSRHARLRRNFQRQLSLAHPGVLRRAALRFFKSPPSGTGVTASVLLLGGTLVYGMIAGQHVSEVVGWFKNVRDTAANSVGFRIAAIALTGQKEVSREEILTSAGVTGRASLLFLDADAARTRLRANPWSADASVLKLYPDRLQIAVTERRAFALWQEHGRVNVIAADGTVLEPFVAGRYSGLPLVVGHGAERRAQEFLAVIECYADLRAMVRASVLVAERRWDLVLKNGIDVRLPEGDIADALDKLVGLDRDKKLLSRDVAAIDLRLADRVTVRLSDAAAQARDEALQAKKKKKGGDA
jgi:cell division protein FtsQ